MVYHGFNVLNPIDYYPEIPMKHMRIWDNQVTWRDINPSPDVFNFTRLDSIVKKAKSEGIKSFSIVLGMTPQWAARNPNQGYYAPWIGPGCNSLPSDFKKWDRYVDVMSKRYKGVIKYYQIWNEPQLKHFLYPYGDRDDLAEMTRRAYIIIKRNDPFARVIAAPILPRPSSGGMKRGSKFLYSLKRKNWPCDIYSCHVYPEIDKGPERFEVLTQRVKNQLEYMNAPTKPLWITEANYNLFGGPLSTKKKVRSYISKTDSMCERLNVGRIYWYAYGIHSNPQLFGIRFSHGSVGTQHIEQFL